jgi:hypothetical protein
LILLHPFEESNEQRMRKTHEYIHGNANMLSILAFIDTPVRFWGVAEPARSIEERLTMKMSLN